MERVKQIVEAITSQKSIDLMPPEMRIVASYVAEFAKEYAPKQESALVGGFLILRCFGPAISNPETSELIPKTPKGISEKSRRNLILITKIIQNLSNGVEFGKKEQYMMQCNNYIKENIDKFTKYFTGVVNFASKSTVSCIPVPTALQLDDKHLFHKLISENTAKFSEKFAEKSDAQNFEKLLEKLGSYQSKTSFSFLDPGDQKAIQEALDKFHEEAAFMGYVMAQKKEKTRKRKKIVNYWIE